MKSVFELNLLIGTLGDNNFVSPQEIKKPAGEFVSSADVNSLYDVLSLAQTNRFEAPWTFHTKLKSDYQTTKEGVIFVCESEKDLAFLRLIAP